MNVPAGRCRARPTKSLGEDLHLGDLRKLSPAPSERSPRSAFATTLVEKELTDAVHDPIVVRFRDPQTSVQSEADEPLGGNSRAQQLIGVCLQGVVCPTLYECHRDAPIKGLLAG
jgi:hypothetical protein